MNRVKVNINIKVKDGFEISEFRKRLQENFKIRNVRLEKDDSNMAQIHKRLGNEIKIIAFDLNTPIYKDQLFGEISIIQEEMSTFEIMGVETEDIQE